MKKLLLISYFFPPDSAVGGLRIARFAKFLPLYGWTPLVLTIQDRYRERLDQERMKDVQGVKIYQTGRMPSLRDGYLLTKIVLRRNHNIENGKATEEKVAVVDHETILQKFKRYFISLFIFLPDENTNWIIPAALKAIGEIKRQSIDCILTSGPPHSSHLIGILAKMTTKVKWIADFRDPWIDFLPYRTPLSRSALSDRIEHWMERLVVHHSDRIITTTRELKDAMKKRYQRESADKFVDILNGIDLDKFLSNGRPGKYEKFTIAYAGALYEGRTPEPLFKAIKSLISENKMEPSEISVKLFGSCQFMDGVPTSEVIRSYGLDGIVEVSKPVPYSEAIEIMRRSHLLLLLVPSIHYLCIPAKVYDYFGAGTKILAFTEDGATSELLKATRSGECFSPDDVSGIGDYICTVMQRENRHLLVNDPASFDRFATKRLTQQLAEQLLAVTDRVQDGFYRERQKSHL